MSTKSNELRAALRAYVAWLDDVENECKYEAYIDHMNVLRERYDIVRVHMLTRRYRGCVPILVKDGITYRRL